MNNKDFTSIIAEDKILIGETEQSIKKQDTFNRTIKDVSEKYL